MYFSAVYCFISFFFFFRHFPFPLLCHRFDFLYPLIFFFFLALLFSFFSSLPNPHPPPFSSSCPFSLSPPPCQKWERFILIFNFRPSSSLPSSSSIPTCAWRGAPSALRESDNPGGRFDDIRDWTPPRPGHLFRLGSGTKGDTHIPTHWYISSKSKVWKEEWEGGIG